MPITIRHANPEDAAKIAAGEREAAQTPGLLNARPGEIPESAFAGKIASLQRSERGLYAVAEREGDIVGHVLLDPMRLAANAHVCTLTIVVYPSRQGQGIGRQLLDYAIQWARRDRHVEKIELMVRATNTRAIRLYRAVGFVEEGRIRKRVRQDDGRYIDDIAMALFVDSQD